MFDIISDQENANLNPCETPLHTYYHSYNQTVWQNNCLGHSYTDTKTPKQCSHFKKQSNMSWKCKKHSYCMNNSIISFSMRLDFELRASCLQSSNLRLKPHLQAILVWLFWRWGLAKYLSRLASNCDPPELSLPNN
jgi:hypothetical protein